MRILRHPQILLALTGLVYMVMVVLEHFYFRRLSGGLPSLDSRVAGFSTESAFTWVTALGPAGSQAVLVWHYLTLDLVFPALFGLTLASLTLAASRNIAFFSGYSQRVRNAAALIWVSPYVLADYCQNLLIGMLLADPVGTRHSLVEAASVLVVLKFVFGGIGVAVILAMLWYSRRYSN